MRKHTIKNVASAGLMSLALALAIVPRTFAEDTVTTQPPTSGSTQRSETTTTTSKEPTRSDTGSPTEVVRENSTEDSMKEASIQPDDSKKQQLPARQRLDDQKKKVCDEKAPQINKAIDNVVSRTDDHAAQILKVYTLTKEFYTKNNLSIANYDALVANVEAKKVVADAAQKTLETHPKFTCNSDGPRADIQSFKNQRLDKVSAFKDYRSAVHELIKAVRAAAVAANVTTPVKEEKK